MAAHHLEVERKYELADGKELAPVADWGLPTLTAAEPVEEHLDAVYFETADGALGRHGVALRRRMGGYDQGWHIKFDAAGARHEVTFDLLSSATRMPAAVKKFVRPMTLDAELLPKVALVTDRTRTVLADANGVNVAEVCEDRVSALDHATGIERVWQELEIELLDSVSANPELGEAIFAEVEAAVAEQGARSSHSTAKIARALGLDADFEARRAEAEAEQEPQKKDKKDKKDKKSKGSKDSKKAKDSKDSQEKERKKKDKKSLPVPLPGSADVLTEILRRRVLALVQADLLVRAGAPDATHRGRIAARQLRSLIRFAVLPYAKSDEQKTRLTELGTSLREYAAQLEEHRNSELLQEILDQAELPQGADSAQVRYNLVMAAETDKDRGATAARRYLDSAVRYELQLDLVDLVADITLVAELPLNVENYLNKVAKRARKSLTKDLEQVVEGDLVTLVESLTPEAAEGDTALHDARKTAKSTRYLLTAFAEAEVPLSEDQQELLARAAEIQSAVGTLTDELTFAQWLVAQKKRAGVDAFALGFLLGQSELRSAYLRQQLVEGLMDRYRDIKKLKLK